MEENVKKIMTTNDKFEFEYISKNVDDTKLLGKEFAKYINKDTIITLNGELGYGKTVFFMGIASHFGIDNDVR